ncbi:hypothetical protein K9K85_01810, partial [Patescibacteria group bacterium]|nr:hypothetical protein [Patescibacteria group bacterium]
VQGGNTFGGLATLGTNDNYDLTFETNGSRKMTILAGGNVGIGTTSPGKDLHIYDAGSETSLALQRDSGSYNNLLIFQDGSDIKYWLGTPSWGPDSGMNFYLFNDDQGKALLQAENDSNNLFLVPAGGNVGIGTTGPNHTLTVGDTSFAATSDEAIQIASSGDTHFIMGEDADNHGRLQWDASENSWEFKLTDGGTLRDNVLVLNNDGKVGVGTASPDYTLHTYTPTASGSSYLQVDRQADTEAVGLVLATAGTPDWYNYVTADADRSLIWNDGITDLMTLTNDGYLGIGPDYTSPNALLDVNNKFLVSDTQVTVNVPLNLASAGDISFASDLIFTNPTASYIKSQAPLYIQAGDPAQNVNLTLRASNAGEVIVDDVLRVVSNAYLDGGATLATNLDMNGQDILAVDKLTVNTIDPIHEINDKEYATFVSFYAGGQKMETSGVINLEFRNSDLKIEGSNYFYVIDFENLEEGSDLWLFWKTVHQDLEKLTIALTPGFNGRVWYQKVDNNKIIIFGDQLGEVSYTLVAPRYDYKKWPNLISSK